jgi:hypothetical protein
MTAAMVTDAAGFVAETVKAGEAVSEAARLAVLKLLLDEINGTGLTPAVADGVMMGLVQVASWDMERGELAAWFRRVAANIDATIMHKES